MERTAQPPTTTAGYTWSDFIALDDDRRELLDGGSSGSGRYDRIEKLHGYADIGVPEYWIVDPERQTLERLVLHSPGSYRSTDTLAGDVTFAPASFPHLVIDLRELWRLPEWFEH